MKNQTIRHFWKELLDTRQFITVVSPKVKPVDVFGFWLTFLRWILFRRKTINRTFSVQKCLKGYLPVNIVFSGNLDQLRNPISSSRIIISKVVLHVNTRQTSKCVRVFYKAQTTNGKRNTSETEKKLITCDHVNKCFKCYKINLNEAANERTLEYSRKSLKCFIISDEEERDDRKCLIVILNTFDLSQCKQRHFWINSPFHG